MAKPKMIPETVRKVVESFSHPKPMRRGSLGERFLKCGKSNCKCASSEEARHGPYFSLTRAVGGRTQSRRLTAQQAERVSQQIAVGRKFRQHLEAYWQACEQWADAELTDPEFESANAEKKKGSRRSSRPRSQQKSTS